MEVWFYHHETAVDPSSAKLRLLIKHPHILIVQSKLAEARGRSHRRKSDSLTAVLMKGKQGIQIDIGNGAAISEQEAFVRKAISQAPNSAARVGLEAGINQVHTPILAIVSPIRNLA